MGNAIKVVESEVAYNAAPGLRASHLKLVMEAPKLYEWQVIKGNQQKETDALALGNLIHTALLEPEKFRKRMVAVPEFSGKGMRAAKADWMASQASDAILVDDKEMDIITGILGTAASDEGIKKILVGGIPELSFYWNDQKTGLRCKARPDYVTEDGWLVNFKTAADASLRKFQYAIQDHWYHLQAASYWTGYREVFGKEPEGYIWIVIEKTAPYLSAIYCADEALMEIGQRDYRQAIDLVDSCTKSGTWPSYQFDRKSGLATGPQSICVPHGMLLEA